MCRGNEGIVRTEPPPYNRLPGKKGQHILLSNRPTFGVLFGAAGFRYTILKDIKHLPLSPGVQNVLYPEATLLD